MTTPRDFDVILYGAGGFVGRQTVAYFAKHASQMRWALAGRNAAKLEATRKAAGDGASNAGVIVADADDDAALSALAQKGRVVLSTAGPFTLLGSKLVAACVEHGTHYVDITGEIPWVNELIKKHHAAASASGTRIVPCCGVDSVPSDLGAYLAAQAMQKVHGEPAVCVRANFAMQGGFNGGTAATFLLIAEGAAKHRTQPFKLGTQPWPPKPQFDPDFQSWVAPYIMTPINVPVVYRSVALTGGGSASPYGVDFVYEETMRAGKGAGGAIAANVIAGLSGALMAAMGMASMRPLLRKLLPAPGEGPSEKTMNEGFLRAEYLARSASGKEVRGTLSDKGDPGNRITTKTVCESALALVQNFDVLPGGPRGGGVLTPVTAFGNVLADRLRGAGMQINFPS